MTGQNVFFFCMCQCSGVTGKHKTVIWQYKPDVFPSQEFYWHLISTNQSFDGACFLCFVLFQFIWMNHRMIVKLFWNLYCYIGVVAEWNNPLRDFTKSEAGSVGIRIQLHYTLDLDKYCSMFVRFKAAFLKVMLLDFICVLSWSARFIQKTNNASLDSSTLRGRSEKTGRLWTERVKDVPSEV